MFALGGVRLWGEVPTAFIAISSLFFLPKWRTGELAGTGKPAIELLKLPLFWCGLALFVLFFIHSWNIAWKWGPGPGGRPMLFPVEPAVSWLPTGMQTGIDSNNPFRNMLFYVTPWLMSCAAWAGLMTRRSQFYLLHGIAITGILYACIALYQHFFNVEKIFGLFETVPSRQGSDIPFWGSLINGNHAAYLFIIINGLCQGLFLIGWRRDLAQFRYNGGIWVLYFAASLVVTFAILLAQSRGAIGVTAVQWLLFLILCSIFFIRRFGNKGFILPAAVLLTMIGITLSFIKNPDVFENQRQDWNKTFDLMENPEFEARYFMWLIARDMMRDRPWFGHGAGSWRYAHLPYLQNYPEFRTEREYWRRNPQTNERERRKRVVWFQNAHVDLAEYVVEWGIIGAAFPMAAMLWLLGKCIRHRRALDLGASAIIGSVLLVWLGAAIEFHFRIPLVLLVWCLVFTTIVRAIERQDKMQN